METREILAEVRNLIAKGWTQNTWARDKRGIEVSPMSGDACKFDVSGAFMHVMDDLDEGSVLACELCEKVEVEPTNFNDHPLRRKSEVLKLLDDIDRILASDEIIEEICHQRIDFERDGS